MDHLFRGQGAHQTQKTHFHRWSHTNCGYFLNALFNQNCCMAVHSQKMWIKSALDEVHHQKFRD